MLFRSKNKTSFSQKNSNSSKHFHKNNILMKKKTFKKAMQTKVFSVIRNVHYNVSYRVVLVFFYIAYNFGITGTHFKKIKEARGKSVLQNNFVNLFIEENLIFKNFSNTSLFSHFNLYKTVKTNSMSDIIFLKKENFGKTFDFSNYSLFDKNSNFISKFNKLPPSNSFIKLINIKKYLKKQSIQIIIKPLRNNTYCTIIPFINKVYKKPIFNKSSGNISQTKGIQRRNTETRRKLYVEAATTLSRFSAKNKKYRFSIFRPKNFH